VASALKIWRRSRREEGYWAKARARSLNMREPEIVENVDLACMTAAQAISRYRNSSTNPEYRIDQLREVRITLEAALGMLENLLD
jgi:hypothetical protein